MIRLLLLISHDLPLRLTTLQRLRGRFSFTAGRRPELPYSVSRRNAKSCGRLQLSFAGGDEEGDSAVGGRINRIKPPLGRLQLLRSSLDSDPRIRASGLGLMDAAASVGRLNVIASTTGMNDRPAAQIAA